MDSSLARDWSFFCSVPCAGCHAFAFFNLCSCILSAVFLRLEWGVFVANHDRDTNEPRPRYGRTTDVVLLQKGCSRIMKKASRCCRNAFRVLSKCFREVTF